MNRNKADEEIDETAVMAALFNEQTLNEQTPVVAEKTAAPVDAIAEAVGAAQPAGSISDDRIMELIAALGETANATNEQGRKLAELLNPPREEYLSEDERLVRGVIERALSPIKQENAVLRRQLDRILSQESEKATQKVVDEIKAKYEDFDPEIIAKQMFAVADYLEKQYREMGHKDKEARALAEQNTRIMWDNPCGIENLYLLHKVRNMPEIFAAGNAGVRRPDTHVTGTNAAVPPRGWKDRLRSSVAEERDSVFNELF